MIVLDNAMAERIEALATYFVDSGRYVPSLTVVGGIARSWWWPLPTAGDRDLVRALLPGSTATSHRAVADALATAVDLAVRTRLRADLLGRKPGRRTIPEAWLSSLTASDPTLPPSLDPAKVAAFAASVQDWVRSGAAVPARVRVVLRVCEPWREGGDWRVELLAQDPDEPTLTVPAADVWSGDAFPPAAIADYLLGLGRVARIAPELAGLLDSAAPSDIDLPGGALVSLVRDRVGALTDAGIGVELPAWWSARRRLRLRAKASTRTAKGPDVAKPAGLGLDTLVSFTWEAALADRRLTKADLLELQRAAAAKQTLVKVRGQWVELDPAELAAIVAAAGTSGEATAAALVRTAMGLDGVALPKGVSAVDGSEVDVVADGWLGELLDGVLHAKVAPIEDVDGFEGTLRPYQQRGAGWLRFLGGLGLGACLADDMGLGKTAQMIAAILAEPVNGPTLVVCPVSVLGNWQRELARFSPSLRVKVHHGADRVRADEQPLAERAEADVVLTTYSLVARDVDLLTQAPWGRLVMDEAQQVKNPGTAQTRAIRRIEAGRRVALTGTPVENRLSELWSLMHVLNPGLLGTAAEFKRRFAVPIEVEHDTVAADRLKRITGPFVLRRVKTDRSIINDLPDKIEQTEHCPLTREQATLYQAVVDDLIERAANAEGIERRGLVLAGIMKLKQVCNHPAHFARDGSRLSGRSGKLNRVEELLDEIVEAGDKVLCFTQYSEWGDLLVPHLTARYGEAPLWLHGGVPRKRRDEMVERFGLSGGPAVFLLSLKAGGTGLNLTAASHVIHLDRWWNPAVEDQATDRAYRIGQRRTVLVHKLVSAGTIEERIDELIMSKRALAQAVVGTGEAWLTDLSTDDLRDVISLRGGTFAEAE